MKSNNMVTLLYYFGGMFSLVLGSTVCVGWIVKSEQIVTVVPGAVAMQFNTALCFACVGVSCLLMKFRRLGSIVSLVPLCLGGLTLVQYGWNISLGIDELFFSHWHTLPGDVSGRMAPNTALCFTLSSLAIISGNSQFGAIRQGPPFILSIMTFCVSGIALIGYAVNHVTGYEWGDVTGMAIHTSIGFVVSSLCLVAHSIRISRVDESEFITRLRSLEEKLQ